MKKKGFTLIELLAVIVILAIIALIATPIVLNMINNARKSAAKSSALGFIEAVDNNNGLADIKNDVDGLNDYNKIIDGEHSVTDIGIKIKGKKPTSGTVTVEKGKVKEASLCIEGYTVTYSNNTATVGSRCNGEQDDGETNNKKYICKRATNLHSEECTSGNSTTYCKYDGFYEKGSRGTKTITYGKLGSGDTLESGDAFDCDVNGDGDYDEETERFYYVADVADSNSNTAALIYYSNVHYGEPDNKFYSSNQYANRDDRFPPNGPDRAILQLPTVTQWSNVSLTSTSRDIKDRDGNVIVSEFSYEGYAARLLTYDELKTACYDGVDLDQKKSLSSRCIYLMENTEYAIGVNKIQYVLLETYYTSSAGAVSAYNSGLINVDRVSRYSNISNGHGIRPVIEVAKSDMKLN